jgi:hypothetical protein
MRGVLSPLLDWKGDKLADPSRQTWLENIPPSLSAAFPIDQPEE